MARTIDEIFSYLDNKENVAGRFLTFTQYDTFEKYMPLDTEINSVNEAVINEGYVVIPETIANIRSKAQRFLESIDNEFNEALENVDDDKKETIKAKYNEKRKIAVDGLEMINAYCDKMKDNWERFRNGDVIKFDDKYGIPSNYVEKINTNATRDSATKDDNTQDAPAQDDQAQEDQVQDGEEQEEGDLSVEDSKNVLQLLKELHETRATRRRAERALIKKRFKEFEESIEESGSVYLDSQKAKGEYRKKISTLREEYNKKTGELLEKKETCENEIDGDRAELATDKGALHDLRKSPVIKYLEKAQKAKAKLEKRLENASTEAEKIILEDKLEAANSTIEKMLQTPEGQEYSNVQSDIRYRRANIRINKKMKKSVSTELRNADKWLKEEKNNAKKEKANTLPAKQSKFKLFVGAIRAKLGIGKYKAEKNAKDSIENMLSSAGEFISGVGAGIAEKAGNAKDAVKGFVSERVDNAISRLENHINQRIAKEQQKTQDIQQKINPENEGR